jgi:hypothetical protein
VIEHSRRMPFTTAGNARARSASQYAGVSSGKEIFMVVHQSIYLHFLRLVCKVVGRTGNLDGLRWTRF